MKKSWLPFNDVNYHRNGYGLDEGPTLNSRRESLSDQINLKAAAAATAPSRNPYANFGTSIDQLGGITLSSTLLLVNLDTDRRYHNIRLDVTAVNFTGGTGLKITGKTSGANTATCTMTPTAFAVPTNPTSITGTVTGYTNGELCTVADATGQGATYTATVGGGNLTALAYVANSATPSAINAGLVVGICQLLVNTVPIRDITAAQTLQIAQFNNETVSLGKLPFFFTEPWRNAQSVKGYPNPDKRTSWDMAGQNTFALKCAITQGYLLVNITGTYEYDFIRNTASGEMDAATYQAAILSAPGLAAAGQPLAPQLYVIAHHVFTPSLNAGVNKLNGQQVDIKPWPWLRMHCLGSTPGDLYQSQILQDGQVVESGYIGTQANGATLDQLREPLIEAGFNTGIFDYSFIADKGQRIQDCLKFTSTLSWSLYSTISQGLTIIQERLQTAYQ